MLDLDFDKFFDRVILKDGLDKSTIKNLSKFGAFVRRTSKGSIRNRKRPSKPGQSPSNQTGLLKEFIFFFYEPATKSVVIGPTKLNGVRSYNKSVPQVLETGGTLRHWRTKKPTTYAPRPYMKPAMDKNLPKFAGLFANSVN